MEYSKINFATNAKIGAKIGKIKPKIPVKKVNNIAAGTNGRTTKLANTETVENAPKVYKISGKVTICAEIVSKNI